MELNEWYKSSHYLTAASLWKAQEDGKILSPEERNFLRLFDFAGDTWNGGLEQWFHNKAGPWAFSLPELLREIGLERTAKILERAIALYFPNGAIPEDEGEKWEMIELLEKFQPQVDKGMMLLTHEVWELDEDVYGSAVEYAKVHGFAVVGSDV